ncbi:SLAM family member 7-like [Carcharodon carcharias]|uniref:SLAM family member 7-like n=1 Tax=Carcharodon carcharias TaxID=13397 RepID=UPI001B7DCB3B|nr:SLAM family member 7-like [Carcharodon carcharias]XP_041068144.1 SLAM family member 7-like [Carcharodon carcharias]
MEIFRLFAVLHCITLCGAALSASPISVTNLRVGVDVRFPINYHSDGQYEVTFKRKSPVGLKVLAWNSENPETPYRIHPQYIQRVRFYRDGFVEIQDVQFDDEGVYEIQTDYLGDQLRVNDQDLFELRVFEPVSQPMVVITGNCNLNCSASSGTDVTCRWKRQSADGIGDDTFYGAVLPLGNMSELQSHTYRCIAENPVSVEMSGPLTMEMCDGDGDRGPRNRWIFFLVPAFSLVILVSAIVLGIKRKARIRSSKLNGEGLIRTC